jgi:hypothetical protein
LQAAVGAVRHKVLAVVVGQVAVAEQVAEQVGMEDFGQAVHREEQVELSVNLAQRVHVRKITLAPVAGLLVWIVVEVEEEEYYLDRVAHMVQFLEQEGIMGLFQVKEVAQVAVAVVLLMHMIRQVMEEQVAQEIVRVMVRYSSLAALGVEDGEHPVAMDTLLRVVQGAPEEKQLINLGIR